MSSSVWSGGRHTYAEQDETDAMAAVWQYAVDDDTQSMSITEHNRTNSEHPRTNYATSNGTGASLH
jgi:hypothetical protein